jgi:hypothetical protein
VRCKYQRLSNKGENKIKKEKKMRQMTRRRKKKNE